ncbi:MAG: HIRAN domain-containing protein [Isosphaeraceae bacterium]
MVAFVLVVCLQAVDELVLTHEKDNPHDPRAVAFHLGGSHLGYIPRQRNRTIAALLDQGAPLRARITQVDPDAAPWQAVEVAVCMIAGHALLAPGKDHEPLFPEL